MASSRRGVLAGLHVVVVEDDEDAREILRAVLEYHGAMVTTAQTGPLAVRTLRQVKPDLVIADMRLGNYKATSLLREARRSGCDAPFLLVSGVDLDEQAVLAQGFAAYLRKPVEHERLVEAVLAIVKSR